MAEFEAAIKSLFESYANGDSAKCAESYDEGCLFVAPASPAVSGKQGIPAVFDALKAKGMAKLVHVKLESATSIGDCYAVTTRLVDALDAAGTTVGQFQDMIVWKKVSGKWLIFREIFNSRQ